MSTAFSTSKAIGERHVMIDREKYILAGPLFPVSEVHRFFGRNYHWYVAAVECTNTSAEVFEFFITFTQKRNMVRLHDVFGVDGAQDGSSHLAPNAMNCRDGVLKRTGLLTISSAVSKKSKKIASISTVGTSHPSWRRGCKWGASSS